MATTITYKKTVQIGNTTHQFDVTGENLHEVIKPLSFGNVYKCGICGDTNLRLGTHVAQSKFKYTTIKCGKCGATLNFGQQQEDDTVYYLKTKIGQGGKKEYDWQAYVNSNNAAPPQAAPPQNQAAPGAPNYYPSQQEYNNQQGQQ